MFIYCFSMQSYGEDVAYEDDRYYGYINMKTRLVDGFLRAIKIRSTPFFGWKVKPVVPCRKILRHVKDILKYHGDG
jgi:hypothetical protein